MRAHTNTHGHFFHMCIGSIKDSFSRIFLYLCISILLQCLYLSQDSLTLSLYLSRFWCRPLFFILLSVCSRKMFRVCVNVCFCRNCQPIKALRKNDLFLPHRKRSRCVISVCVSIYTDLEQLEDE